MKKHKVAVMAGDGIGTEVMPEGLRVLEAVTQKHGIEIEYTHFDWSSAEYYQQHGTMLPEDWFDQLKGFDAIFIWGCWLA